MRTPPPLPDDLLLFAPAVPQRRRASGWTAEAQRAFIMVLARSGLVSVAAASVGLTARSAYQLRARPEAAGFAEAWDIALGLGREVQRDAVLARVVAGRVEPVWYRGRIVGERVRHNDGLLIAAMKAVEAELTGGVPPHRARLQDMAERAEADARFGPVDWGDGFDPGPVAWPAAAAQAVYPQAARRLRARKAAEAKADADWAAEYARLERRAKWEASLPPPRPPLRVRGL